MKYIPYDSETVKDHVEIFGKEFGAHGKFQVGFGSSKKSTENPVDIQGSFVTPNHVEYEVAFAVQDGPYPLNGGRVLIISDHLDAELGDEGNVAEQVCVNGLPYARISMFVNRTSTDPRPPKDFVTGEPLPRDTWLALEKQYYWRLYRTDLREDGVHPALDLTASGEDQF